MQILSWLFGLCVMLIKMCGLRTDGDVEAAIVAGASLVGFIFAPSKRQIRPDAVSLLKEILPVPKVGVFANQSYQEIMRVLEQVPLDYIQLHGPQDAALGPSLPVHVIQTYYSEHSQVKPYSYLLIDGMLNGQSGGLGVQADWSLARSLATREPLLLAGGLNPDNVAKAIRSVHPAGVDVSSGIEVNGRKDIERMKKFVEAVRRCSNE